jgi:hypothetical protein
MSDTPRTDALIYRKNTIEMQRHELLDLALALERELAEAKNDADRYRYVRSIWGLPDEKFNAAIDAAMKEGGK